MQVAVQLLWCIALLLRSGTCVLCVQGAFGWLSLPIGILRTGCSRILFS